MTLAIFAAVYVGFARTFFLRPWFPETAALMSPPEPFFYFHGAVSTARFVVLLVQSALVGIGRTDLHRALGRIGAVLVGARLVPRRDVQSHKRLMLIGSIAIINAALARWPVVFESGGPVLRFVLAARLL